MADQNNAAWVGGLFSNMSGLGNTIAQNLLMYKMFGGGAPKKPKLADQPIGEPENIQYGAGNREIYGDGMKPGTHEISLNYTAPKQGRQLNNTRPVKMKDGTYMKANSVYLPPIDTPIKTPASIYVPSVGENGSNITEAELPEVASGSNKSEVYKEAHVTDATIAQSNPTAFNEQKELTIEDFNPLSSPFSSPISSSSSAPVPAYNSTTVLYDESVNLDDSSSYALDYDDCNIFNPKGKKDILLF
jgi:hypothetical protein